MNSLIFLIVTRQFLITTALSTPELCVGNKRSFRSVVLISLQRAYELFIFQIEETDIAVLYWFAQA